MGKLVHFQADGAVRDFKLDRERVTIGRRPDNDICLPQPPVSGEHAAVVTILADSFLEDLDSTNGTLVNGKPVTRHFLRDLDEIDIGLQLLVYLADENARLDNWTRRFGRSDNLSPDEERDGAESGVTQTFVPVAPSHGNRRSDAAATPQTSLASPDEHAVLADLDGVASGSVSPEPAANESPRRDSPSLPLFALKVLKGANAGRTIPLNKAETMLGRAGVQVAALRRTGRETTLVPIEGSTPPRVNGLPMILGGRPLAVGDVIEIAGTTLELVAFRDRPAG